MRFRPVCLSSLIVSPVKETFSYASNRFSQGMTLRLFLNFWFTCTFMRSNLVVSLLLNQQPSCLILNQIWTFLSTTNNSPTIFLRTFAFKLKKKSCKLFNDQTWLSKNNTWNASMQSNELKFNVLKGHFYVLLFPPHLCLAHQNRHFYWCLVKH